MDESMSDQDFILLLISLYKENSVLWDVNSQFYNNKRERQIALQNMVNVLSMYRPDYDVNRLKIKINILRSNFNKEYNKLRKLIAETEEPVPPKLWYYDEFKFIKSEEEDQLENSGEHASPTFVSVLEEPETKVHINTTTAKRRRLSKPFTKSMNKPVINLSTCPTNPPRKLLDTSEEPELLAKSWAIAWSRLADDQKKFAKKVISDVLFEAEMGSLTRHGVRFLTKSEASTSSASSHFAVQTTPTVRKIKINRLSTEEADVNSSEQCQETACDESTDAEE